MYELKDLRGKVLKKHSTMYFIKGDLCKAGVVQVSVMPLDATMGILTITAADGLSLTTTSNLDNIKRTLAYWRKIEGTPLFFGGQAAGVVSRNNPVLGHTTAKSKVAALRRVRGYISRAETATGRKRPTHAITFEKDTKFPDKPVTFCGQAFSGDKWTLTDDLPAGAEFCCKCQRSVNAIR